GRDGAAGAGAREVAGGEQRLGGARRIPAGRQRAPPSRAETVAGDEGRPVAADEGRRGGKARAAAALRSPGPRHHRGEEARPLRERAVGIAQLALAVEEEIVAARPGEAQVGRG